MDRHVVFIHGLRRVGHKVWMSGQPPELWPLWLSKDIEKLGIWSVEYDSAPTLWRGHSMARVDRANNVLARVLAEDRLQKGDIAFVTHSFGGLVFEQMLRVANERAPAEPNVAEGELARTGICRHRSPYWRRLASIAHASVLERAILTASMPPSDF